MQSSELCVCGSGKPFRKCCEPLLVFKEKARTPKQLVRARYAAYALGGYREYLIKTWHPQTAQELSIGDLDTGYDWKGLEILHTEQKGNMGLVEFKAIYSDHGGPDQIHHEKSFFHRWKNTWLYLGGEEARENSETSVYDELD